jgi:hypothetical protein
MKTLMRLTSIILLIVLSSTAAIAQSKKSAPDPNVLIGLEIVDHKYPDGWKAIDGLPTGFSKIGGDAIRSSNTYALVSKKKLAVNSKTPPHRFVIVDVKPTKYSRSKRHNMQRNCEHPTIKNTENVGLFAFSRFVEADYCRVKTKNIIEAWTINFETGELKKIDHKGMSCNITYYLSGLGPTCKKVEGLTNAK